MGNFQNRKSNAAVGKFGFKTLPFPVDRAGTWRKILQFRGRWDNTHLTVLYKGSPPLQLLPGMRFLTTRHTPAGITYSHNSNKERMLSKRRHPLNYYALTILLLVHCFQHLSCRYFLLRRKGCPTIEHFFQVRGQFYHLSLSEKLG